MEYDNDAPYTGHKKILKIEPTGTVTMLSPGSPTRLIPRKGRRHKCMYDTGAGLLSLGVFTQTLKHDLSAEGGMLRIRYTLDLDAHLLRKRHHRPPQEAGRHAGRHGDPVTPAAP